MNKEDFLQPLVEQVLNDIDFINRYESLSKTFESRDETFLYTNYEILKIAHELGYELKYSKAKEFHLSEKKGKYYFGFGFTLRFHSLEIGCSVKNESLMISSSAPWGFWVNLITNNEKKIRKPMFSNYDELREILKNSFSIYEDFKTELIKQDKTV
jgi:hypothetical protein